LSFSAVSAPLREALFLAFIILFAVPA
jgi:hypothetical protein